LLLAISATKIEEGHFLLDEILSILFKNFIEAYPTSALIFKRLWELNPELLIKAIGQFCNDTRVGSKLNAAKALEIV